MSTTSRFIWTALANNQLRNLGLGLDEIRIKKDFDTFDFQKTGKFGMAKGEKKGREWYYVALKVGDVGVPNFTDPETVDFLYDDDRYGLPTSIIVSCTKLSPNERKALPKKSVTVGIVDGVIDARAL